VYNECRNQGLEAGTVDILICAVVAREVGRFSPAIAA
jgi:hypothetical protein